MPDYRIDSQTGALIFTDKGSKPTLEEISTQIDDLTKRIEDLESLLLEKEEG